MIHQRLKSNTEVEVLVDHPDEDTMCAFIEGRLEEEAASQMVSHLITCSFCRRTTAQVTRLDSQVSPEYDAPADDTGPGRLREVLEGLVSKLIPGQQEDVVFAYQNPPEEETEKTENTDNDSGPSHSD